MLYVVLTIQIIITAAFFWFNENNDPMSSLKPLFTQSSEDFNQLVITDDKNEKISLVKKDGQWQLPDYYQMPVDPSKISSLLNNLDSVSVNWPVSDTESSHTRFEVAENNFQKKLEVYQDGKLVETLYMGTSPGFRKSHLRLAGDEKVYSAKLSHYDILANDEDWFDKDLLKVSNISQIKGTDFSLRFVDDKWQWNPEAVTPSATTEPNNDEENTPELDDPKAAQLTLNLETLKIISVVDKSPLEPKLSLEVSTSEGILSYQFFTDENKFFVKRNDFENAFEISKTDFEAISSVDYPSIAIMENTEDESTGS